MLQFACQFKFFPFSDCSCSWTFGLYRTVCFIYRVACEFCDEAGHEDIVTKLVEIQCVLQDVGSNIATPRQTSPQRNIEKTKFNVDATKELEQWIDAYHNQLPPLRNFILPSGGKSAAMLHVARSICRRAERRVMPLVHSGNVEPEVGSFLNRLSDFLFTAGRFVSKMEGKTEKIYRRIQRWQKRNSTDP